jgi:hypothetical protein
MCPSGRPPQGHGDVALDAGLDDPAVLGEEPPDFRRVVAGLLAHHVLARGAPEVVLEDRAVVVDLPEGQEAHAGHGLVSHLGDEGVLHAEGLRKVAHQGTHEVGAGGRGGPFDDGPQPLLALLALGDVHGGADGGRLAVVEHDHRRGHIEPPLAPVPGEEAHFVAVRRRLSAQAGRSPVTEKVLRLRGSEAPGDLFEQLLRAVAGESLARGIDVQEPVGAVDEDGRGGGFGQDPEPLVGLPHGEPGGATLESWSHG